MKNLFLAHPLDLVQNSFPVFGTASQALVTALIFTVVVLIVYLIIDHLPKPRKNLITAKNEPTYAKTVIAFVVLGMISTGWDVWWHRAVGRDTFWIPPHIGLYIFAAASILTAFYVWRHSRDKVWKHIMFVLLFIPISAAFDNFFHAFWGVENYSTPIRLSWSPGHLMLSLSIAITIAMLLSVLTRFRKTNDFAFFGNLCIAAIYVVFVFISMPFHPTEGWGQIAGFAGAGVFALVFVATALTAEYTIGQRLDATFMTIFALLLILISSGKEIASHVMMMPHDKPPIWLTMFALLAPAIILDLTKNRFPMWIRGMFAGAIWAAILFGFSTQFFQPEFQYGLIEITTAVTFAAVGGLTVASIFSIFHLDDEKHIEKLLKKW